MRGRHHAPLLVALTALAGCSPWPAPPPPLEAPEAETVYRLTDREGAPRGLWTVQTDAAGARAEHLRLEAPDRRLTLDGLWQPGVEAGTGQWTGKVQAGPLVSRSTLSVGAPQTVAERRDGLEVRRVETATPDSSLFWPQTVVATDDDPGSVILWERLARALPAMDTPRELAALDPRRGLPVRLRVEPLAARAATLHGAPLRTRRFFVGSPATGRTFWVDDRGRLLQVSPGPAGTTVALNGFVPGEAPTRSRPAALEAETVSLEREDARLAGTLTRPPEAAGRPTVLLIHGSGPMNRDEAPFMVFRDLAWGLGRRGYPVLRYDKRGVAQSRLDDESHVGLESLVGDAAAWARWLAHHPEGAGCVVVLGHSEGGYIAPLVAGEVPAVAGVVHLAGPVDDMFTTLEEQGRLILTAHGATEAELSRTQAQQALLFRRLRADEELPGGAGPAGATAWLRSHARHDPTPPLLALRVPLLALFADGDLQVPAASQATRLRELLGDRPEVTIETLPGLDHLFMDDRGGFSGMGLFGHPDRRLAPEVVARVADWLDGIRCPDPAGDSVDP